MLSTEAKTENKSESKLQKKEKNRISITRTLGPVSDLEKHLPPEWWRTLFNSLYLKTDGDVVENEANTICDIDMIFKNTDIHRDSAVLDLCCGQGRHSIELAKRGLKKIHGLDRSTYLIRLARKRTRQKGYDINFSEGDARRIKLKESSMDFVIVMGNSFGYFEKLEDDRTVLESIKKVLKSEGTLVLDIVDGTWMKTHFEKRSWEWINQSYFVCRERSLTSDTNRIISREVITNVELGVIADQFYAERLYSFDEIKSVLEELGFSKVILHGNLSPESERNQDLGMMANRLFITAKAPKKISIEKKTRVINLGVVMGDPRLPDQVKKDNKFNAEDFETIQKLKNALQKIPNLKTQYFDEHGKLLNKLKDFKGDLILNLCDEGFENTATKELHVPAYMEMLGIPYTGATPASLGLCYNKSMIRAIADSIDVPVPLETYYDPSDQSATLPSIFPALIKPNIGDSSIGITQKAVVNNAEELVNYINFIKELLPDVPILIQEFLSGKEYSVGIIGNPSRFEILPILEVDYSHLPEELPRILSYESKWIPESPYWTSIKYHEANLDEMEFRNIVEYSKKLFIKTECRDYARFDFRADSKGTIKLLEVNPNPGWCWDGKLNYMAGFAGIEYQELLAKIINSACERININ
jgi:D-alanine-D-alanine ligase